MPPEIIDAEFEVIEPPRRPQTSPPARWSFWRDDVPNIVGLVVAAVVAVVIRSWIFAAFR